MTIRITYNQLEELTEMVKGKSGKKFKKEKKQKQKIKYPKSYLSSKVKKRRKQGFSRKK